MICITLTLLCDLSPTFFFRPVAQFSIDLFDLEDCDGSGAAEHFIDIALDNVSLQEVRHAY